MVPDALVVVVLDLGVLVRVGVAVDLGARVPSRLGAVVRRVGVTLFDFDGVGLALGVAVVRRGVDDAVTGRDGVTDEGVAAGSGSSRLTSMLAVSCSTNHPVPAISISVVSEARIGPISPCRRDRRWLVMVCSLAHPTAG
jgi:hypothetical protein